AHRPARDAELLVRRARADDVCRCELAGDQPGIGFVDAPRLGRSFANELDPKPLHAAREQLRNERRGALRLCIEHGVAAADVDDHGMYEPDAIAQCDLMALARSAARAKVAAVR